ncbi:permease [bacterium]|nr:permease [bacterium]
MTYHLKIQFYQVLLISGNTLAALLPYFLIGIVLGEILRRSPWVKTIYQGCKKSPFSSTILAALLGMVSPLCTYGTVPIVLLLFRRGVHLAPIVTFLSVSSLMNPQLFIITWGGISPEMAIVRAGTVFLFGIIIGLMLYRVPSRLVINSNIHDNGFDPDNIARIADINWKNIFKDSWNSIQFVGFYLVIGIILGSMIEVFVPPGWIDSIFTNNEYTSVLIGALLGVPLYACGGGTVPLIDSLLSMGMGKGAALSFFIVGPATRITPLMALAAVLRPMFIVVYIIFLIIYSVISGITYN